MQEKALPFNPQSYVEYIKGKEKIGKIKFQDFVKFLVKEELELDEAILKHFFGFFNFQGYFDSKSVINLLIPNSQFLSAINRDFKTDLARQLHEKEKFFFFQILILELKLSKYFIQSFQHYFQKNIYDLKDFFYFNNIHEKLVFLYKQKNYTKIDFTVLKNISHRLKRRGNSFNNIAELFTIFPVLDENQFFIFPHQNSDLEIRLKGIIIENLTEISENIFKDFINEVKIKKKIKIGKETKTNIIAKNSPSNSKSHLKKKNNIKKKVMENNDKFKNEIKKKVTKKIMKIDEASNKTTTKKKKDNKKLKVEKSKNKKKPTKNIPLKLPEIKEKNENEKSESNLKVNSFNNNEIEVINNEIQKESKDVEKNSLTLIQKRIMNLLQNKKEQLEKIKEDIKSYRIIEENKNKFLKEKVVHKRMSLIGESKLICGLKKRMSLRNDSFMIKKFSKNKFMENDKSLQFNAKSRKSLLLQFKTQSKNSLKKNDDILKFNAQSSNLLIKNDDILQFKKQSKSKILLKKNHDYLEIKTQLKIKNKIDKEKGLDKTKIRFSKIELNNKKLPIISKSKSFIDKKKGLKLKSKSFIDEKKGLKKKTEKQKKSILKKSSIQIIEENEENKKNNSAKKLIESLIQEELTQITKDGYNPFSVQAENNYLKKIKKELNQKKEQEEKDKQEVVKNIIDIIVPKVFEESEKKNNLQFSNFKLKKEHRNETLKNNNNCNQNTINTIMPTKQIVLDKTIGYKKNFEKFVENNIIKEHLIQNKDLKSFSRANTMTNKNNEFRSLDKYRRSNSISQTLFFFSNSNSNHNQETRKSCLNISNTKPFVFPKKNIIPGNSLSISHISDNESICSNNSILIKNKPKNNFEFCDFIQKLLKYTKKINAYQIELFKSNPNFNLLGIFEIYNKNLNGKMTLNELEYFLSDLHLKLTALQFKRLVFYFNYFLTDKDISNFIHFSDFIKMFIPMDNKNYNQDVDYFNDKFNLKIIEKEYVVENFSIKKVEIVIIQRIITMILKMIRSLTSVIKSMDGKIRDCFLFISQKKEFIEISNLKAFLKKNGRSYSDLHYKLFYKAFLLNNFENISFNSFSRFFSIPLWKLTK